MSYRFSLTNKEYESVVSLESTTRASSFRWSQRWAVATV